MFIYILVSALLRGGADIKEFYYVSKLQDSF